MKQFNIVKNQQIVFGHIIPKNAIYGKFTYNGVYKKPVDGAFETVKNKHGKVVFTKDGMPKMRQVYKLVPFKNTVIYSLEDFKEYRRSNNKFCQIYILYADSQKWTLANTDDNATLEKLYEFIKNRLKDQGQYLRLLKSPEKPCINGNAITMPKRRNLQKDYLYRGIPMKNPDDTDVKFNTHCSGSSNLKACHPIDDRPVYRPKNRPYKPEKEEVHKILLSDTMADGTPFMVKVTNNNHYV